MLKSPEEYLSGLDFDPPNPPAGARNLDPGERAFVEKYLGLDMDGLLPVNPEPLPMPLPLPEPLAEPLLAEAPAKMAIAARPVLERTPEIVIAQARDTRPIIVAEPREEIKSAPAEKIEVKTAAEIAVPETATEESGVKAETAEPAQIELKEEILPAEPIAVAEESLAEELSPRDKMRQAEEIQAVSFFISGQIFLLPVEGIQEVLRHMELVRVPQTPEYIAGAINLRGTVMPVVHLSALLTNSATRVYNEKSFIIVTGAQSMQMGLIIDRVSSMHMIPQKKIIWNVESKLGDAGEFLCALVDLDDKVCGMIEPETITRKLLSEI